MTPECIGADIWLSEPCITDDFSEISVVDA